MARLLTLWSQNIRDPKRKEDFEAALRNSTVLITRLLELLTEMERQISAEEASKESYENPSWAYKQAHLNGRKAQIKAIRDLFNFIEG